jgi:hypothetical protein
MVEVGLSFRLRPFGINGYRHLLRNPSREFLHLKFFSPLIQVFCIKKDENFGPGIGCQRDSESSINVFSYPIYLSCLSPSWFN